MPGKRLIADPSPLKPQKAVRPLVIVGAGNMGGAFARGFIAAGLGPRLVIIDPGLSPAAARQLRKAGAATAPDIGALRGHSPEAIILAVKPQMMPSVAPAYAPYARNALVISIAAGTTLESLEAWLETPKALVRAMPNLPASVGKGITAAFAAPDIAPGQRRLADKLLRAIGDLVWLHDEVMMNTVTALSGSGPAYAFLLVEAMAAAGERAGMPREMAKLLARRTIEGAATLLESSRQDPAELRRSVTSPGGTTEAALKVLAADGRFENLIAEAVAAATERSIELSKSK
jgi:pyrroline-5-carboxylate reductase